MRRLRVRGGGRLRGLALTPGDKSMSHRAVVLASLAEGTSSIWGFLNAADCVHTALAMVEMGVAVRGLPGKELEIDGVGLRGLRPPDGPLDMGNSGTGMRLLLGVLAGQGFEATLTGDESLSGRPMNRIATPLGMMGARVTGRGERLLPPVTVRGGDLRGIEYHTPMASAQVKSAVLLAGLNAEGPTTVVEPARSRDHTERMLKAMGADVETDDCAVTLRPGRSLVACEMTVPGDFSSAAFLVAAGLLVPDSEVAAQGVLLNPTRTGLVEALAAMGVWVAVGHKWEVAGEPVGNLAGETVALRGAEVGGELIPRMVDEVPLLAVLATQAEGTTVVRDAAELRVKECDRLAVMASVLNAMGARVEERPDGLVIAGPTPLRGASVDSHGDHRVAMSAFVAGLVAQGETVIENTDCIATSFPEFVELMQELGADCVEEQV